MKYLSENIYDPSIIKNQEKYIRYYKLNMIMNVIILFSYVGIILQTVTTISNIFIIILIILSSTIIGIFLILLCNMFVSKKNEKYFGYVLKDLCDANLYYEIVLSNKKNTEKIFRYDYNLIAAIYLKGNIKRAQDLLEETKMPLVLSDNLYIMLYSVSENPKSREAAQRNAIRHTKSTIFRKKNILASDYLKAILVDDYQSALEFRLEMKVDNKYEEVIKHYSLGNIYFKLNDLQKSLEYYNNVVENGNNLVYVTLASNMINEIETILDNKE